MHRQSHTHRSWQARQRGLQRRGFALADAVVGGTLLAVGIAALISVSSRALSAQADGANRVQAAWLADELLAMVLVEGPEIYPKIYDSAGSFAAPFEQFEYYVEIRDKGVNLPFEVVVTVTWPGAKLPVQLTTLITQPYETDEEYPIYPSEALDRNERWEEKLRRAEFGDDVDF